MSKLFLLILFVFVTFADNKFPETEWEWWQESYNRSNFKSKENGDRKLRDIRIKMECINMNISSLMENMNSEDIPDYYLRLNSTGRDFYTADWINGSKKEDDIIKMLEIVYERVVLLNRQVETNRGGTLPSIPGKPLDKW
jgi:hypothetical protein